MAESKIRKDIALIYVPYALFTWDAANKFWEAPYTPPSGMRICGYLVSATNGLAVMGARPTTNGVRVCGWVPFTGQSVGSSYTFDCYAILRNDGA